MANDRLTNLAGALPGLVGTGNAILGSTNSINSLLSGGKISADAYRSQGEQASALANYELELGRLDFKRQSNDLVRQMQLTLGRQKVQNAVSGFSSDSKSFLIQMSETINEFDGALSRAKTDLSIRENNIRFNAAQAQLDAENRARAAKYESEVQAYQVELQKAEQKRKLVGQVAQAAATYYGGGG